MRHEQNDVAAIVYDIRKYHLGRFEEAVLSLFHYTSSLMNDSNSVAGELIVAAGEL